MATTLPSIPSEFISVVLRDLEAVEANPRYRINVFKWHTPHPENSYCEVCLAGAVIANSLGGHPSCALTPASFDDPTHLKLIAVDELRQGNWAYFLSANGVAPSPSLKPPITIPNFASDPPGWKRSVAAFASHLQCFGH